MWLGWRSKGSAPLSLAQNHQPSLSSKKRNFIDLTSSDDEEPAARKKSRSASQSTTASAESISEYGKGRGQSRNPGKIILIFVTNPASIYSHYPIIWGGKLHNSNRLYKFYKACLIFSGTAECLEKRLNHNSPLSFSSSNEYVSGVKIPPPQPSPAESRRMFLDNLRVVEDVTLTNTIDDSSPRLDFKFIKKNVLGTGVEEATDEFMIGCTCRKNNGRDIGCEYTSCECLEDSARTDNERKVFPYAAGKDTTHCLRDFYLSHGWHVFECNARCNCNSNCKNRVVQHGRKVPLEIFKTRNRGWGE